MSEIRTAAERLEKVRETLEGFQGARAGSRAARRLALSRGQNLLIGAALHAAARLDKGLEPTELEEQLLKMLRAGADDDAEVASWGRLFAEQRSARGGVKVFPSAINQLDVNTGYGMEDLRADLAEVTPEIVAQPNVAIVDVTKTTPGEEKDSEEFLQALADCGSGITVLTTPEERQGLTAVAGFPLQVHLAPHAFYCERRSNEHGHDEIYWALSAGTDHRAKVSGKTPEFGSVLTGHTRYFTAPHNFTFVDGPVRGYVAVNIECWEADDSSGGFYNKMREVLATLAERLAEGAESQTYNPPAGGGDNAESWAALLAVVLGLVNLLLGWLTNDDDLVAERSIGFSREALKRYFTPEGRDEAWMFDGGQGGRHRLWLRGTVKEITPEGKRRVKNATGAWGTTYSMLYEKNLGAPLTAVGGGPTFYVDGATNELRTGGNSIPGVRTVVPPGAAMYDGKVYCMYLGLDHQLYWCARSEDGTWSTPTGIGGWNTRHSPALAVHNNTLYSAHVGVDGSIWISTFNGQGWNYPTALGDVKTTSAPALVSHKNVLHCAYRNAYDRICLTWSANGTEWAKPYVGGESTYEAPALGSARDRLHLAFRDLRGNVQVCEWTSDSRWGPDTQIQTGGYGSPCLTNTTVGLTAHFVQ
ncbi:sialidase family protein [Streptomyces sp. NPDC013953]|uniref:sialidase family protein n=1 Tax=Streptomyces sp. NPDC013953 TaxID=3364868 RepID=UPI0036FDB474